MNAGPSLIFAPEALDDVEEIDAYYESQAEGLGLRFRESVANAVTTIIERPQSFPVIYRGLRRTHVGVFPVGIIYRLTSQEFLVLAVFDLRRDPVELRRLLGDR